jgi:DNA adenine methylase
VQLECDDALRVITRFDAPDTVHYVDAPYPASTRGARWATRAYAHELSDADHRRLAETLHALRGMAVVSGYPGPLYHELYGGWPVVARCARTNGARGATEALWLSPRAAARLGARQLALLEEEPG